MKKQLGIGLCLLLLVTTGCDKKEQKVLTQVEKWDQISLESSEMVSWIEEIADAGKYMIAKKNVQTGEEKIYLYQEQKGFLDQGTQITLQDNVCNYGQIHVAKDGKTVFFSAMPTETENTEVTWQNMKIYSGVLEGTKIDQIEEVRQVNRQTSLLGEVMEDGTLFYLSGWFGENESNPQACLAERKQDGYEVKEIHPADNVGWEDITQICEAKVGDQNYMLATAIGEDGFVESILKGQREGENMSNWEEIALPENIEGKIYGVSSLAEGEVVYFLCYDQTANTSNVYRISTESLCESLEKEKTYEKCSYDAYDDVTFSLKLRNKGNMQEKEGVYYEIFVRSFADSDGDGIGDLKGITNKLDYLKNLGIDGIWLTPILESPSYHGYDVTDYKKIKQEYGTEEDLKQLIKEAHKRDMKVIMDFVINHTSSQHTWFQSASTDADSEYKNYYRWVKKSDSTDFDRFVKSSWGTRVWHKSGDEYYYGIFDASMPDLNYNNEKVREEIKDAAKKWLELGLDGFRLDAALHIYGIHEFEQMEDPEAANIQWWNEFACACEEVNPDVYLVGEAWDGSKPLAEYTQPFDTKFDFTLAQDLMEAIKQEEAVETSFDTSLAEYLQEIEDTYEKNSGGAYLDGVFATNHDQDRIMSQVNDETKAKLMANVYLTLPGNPFIYYGEELGMYGEGEDEHKREPFLWSESGTKGDTSWEENTQNKTLASLEEQKKQPDSMYRHYKKLLQVRKEHAALQQGKYEVYHTENTEILGFYRKNEQEKLLVLHNFSDREIVLDCSEITIKEVIYGSKQNNEKKLKLHPFESLIIVV